MSKILSLVDRFKEPSTYAGLAAVAGLLGVTQPQFQEYALAASGFFAFLAIILREVDRSPKEE